jgi:hypothetical protein
MRKRGRFVVSVWLALALGLWATRAQAVNFHFSFTGNFASPGTVTGEILGLQPSGSSQATGVIIDTTTTHLPVFLPYNFFNDPTFSTFGNFFAVSDGQIGTTQLTISGHAVGGNGPAITLTFNNIVGYETGTTPIYETSLSISANGHVIGKVADDFWFNPGTLTFPLIPEPGSMVIFGAGLIGLAIAFRDVRGLTAARAMPLCRERSRRA